MTASWFETVGSEVAYRGGWSTVRLDQVRMPDGTIAEREVVEQLDAVGVVPLTQDREVLLLSQYRHPIGTSVIEIPAGKLDLDGESVQDAAQRELIEETGHRASQMIPLVTFLNSAGWTNERTHLFLGRDLEPSLAPAGFVAKAEEAHMEVLRWPLKDALDAVRSGAITDAKTIIGLLLTDAHGGAF